MKAKSMAKQFVLTSILFMVVLSSNAQTSIKPAATEDTTLGPKPSITIENVSPAGHCDDQELTFFTAWADNYIILKRRSDTGWINENRNINTDWASQTLKAGVTRLIYKSLDERGTYQFVVKAFKGNSYRQSDIITRQPCINTGPQK